MRMSIVVTVISSQLNENWPVEYIYKLSVEANLGEYFNIFVKSICAVCLFIS